jgi:hypothetical protein
MHDTKSSPLVSGASEKYILPPQLREFAELSPFQNRKTLAKAYELNAIF